MHSEVKTQTKVLVLGVGNLLLKDEGIGPRVIEELKKEALPSGVAAIDAGTQILDTILSQNYSKKFIIIDAVKADGPAGAIYKFTPEDIREEAEVKLSLHQATVIEALKILEFQGRLPEQVVIFGVVPKDIGWGLDVSEELTVKIPDVIKLIKEEMKKC